jgi:hypothetical protein
LKYSFFRNFECEIVKVLDEVIYIEFKSDLIGKRILPKGQWIDTDNNISILKLYPEV